MPPPPQELSGGRKIALHLFSYITLTCLNRTRRNRECPEYMKQCSLNANTLLRATCLVAFTTEHTQALTFGVCFSKTEFHLPNNLDENHCANTNALAARWMKQA